MDWVIALFVFAAQLLCCVYVENKLLRLLPTATAVLVMLLTLALGSGLGTLGTLGALALLIPEGKSLLMGALAWLLYKLVLFTK